MTNLKKMIDRLCPNGIDFIELGKLGKFYGGLTGKTKEDFINGNEKFATYKNVYSNPSLNLNIDDKVKISGNERQNILKYGDVIFTGSSETPDECGLSSVLTRVPEEKLYLNSFCFFFRFENPELLLPDFSKHLFRSQMIRNQIRKTASGVTRFNISKKRMEKVIVPVPPVDIQKEIVRILDSFTELTAELTAELTVREKQLDYYESKLLRFNDVTYDSLKNLCDIVDYRGKTPKKTESGIFLVTAKNIRRGYIDYKKSEEYISEKDYNLVMRRGKPLIGDVLITTEAPCGNVAQVDREDIALAQRVIKYRPKNQDKLNSKFLKYILLSREFQARLFRASTGGTVKGIKGSKLHEFMIPLPSIEVQKKIANILEKFESLFNDISQGIPAEIEARQKQYEYYRNELLSFKGKEVDRDE